VVLSFANKNWGPIGLALILATALACGSESSDGCSVETDCSNGFFCNNKSAGYAEKVPAKYMGLCLLEETKSCFEADCAVKGRCVYDPELKKCVAVSEDDCKASSLCQTAGACTLVEDICSTVGKGYGAPCTNDSECGESLCLISDYAPLGWCTASCEEEQQPCGEQGDDGKFPAYCIRMPNSFKSSTLQFCAPLCSDLFECSALADFWGTCDIPKYKGNPIYGQGVGIEICQAPAAHGKGQVNPDTCEGWDTALGGGLESTVNLCRAYCEYLVTCQEVEPSGYNQECCGYGCLLKIAPEGVVLNKHDKEAKCYVQNFFAWRDTPEVCEKPVSECNGKPFDPRPSQ
jgi:hypothetical protein